MKYLYELTRLNCEVLGRFNSIEECAKFVEESEGLPVDSVDEKCYGAIINTHINLYGGTKFDLPFMVRQIRVA